jgi:predicted transcriptional regulator
MVEEIFSLRSTGMSQQKIGDLVGIHQTEVSRILRGKSWIDRAQARKV